MRRTMLVVGLAVVLLALIAGGSGQARPAKRTPLQMATWNFCNQSCPDWDRRLRAFARTIAATRPDVLAVQEVDTRDQRLARTAAVLRPLGYVATDPTIYRSCPGGCESHLFVNTARIRVLTTVVGIVPSRVLPARARANPVSYALLEDRSSGARLLALSVHLEKQNGTGLNGPDDRARNAAASALARWSQSATAAAGGSSVAVAIMGDFNSYPRKQPNGPHRVLGRFGFRNAENARTTIGGQFATVNKTPADAAWNGFPPRPRRFELGGPRIDGILTKGLPKALRHQVYVRTRADGRFDERYRASDHNMVRAWFAVAR